MGNSQSVQEVCACNLVCAAKQDLSATMLLCAGLRSATGGC